MEIQQIKTFTAPNIYSLIDPIIKIDLELGEFRDISTKEIGNLADRIIELFPGVKNHRCTDESWDNFVDRMKKGTGLAHVVEHLCLETQNILDCEVDYGQCRSMGEDIQSLIYPCTYPIIGKACATFVIDTLNNLIQDKSINSGSDLDKLKELFSKYDHGVSTKAIINEARKRGIPVSSVNDGDLVRLGYGKYQRCISATLFEDTSSIAVDNACNKSLTKELLDEATIPTPQGSVCLSVIEAIHLAKEIGYPLVVKPNDGNKGESVFTNLRDEKELESAFAQASEAGNEVIVERFIEGKDYRILVVGGKVVAVAERIPAHIIGDGQRTIEELIYIENQVPLRGQGHEKPLTKIPIDDKTTEILKKQGLKLDDIADKNRFVKLRDNANLSTGSIAIDCTDIIHPKNKEAAVLATEVIGLDIAGIDMIIPDISKPIDADYGAIVEVNAAPGIRMHLNPTKGESRNVAAAIIDMIYPAGVPFTLPIVAITGTNGKTTTTRLISQILRNSGYKVGTTTSDGIYLNDQCLQEGDTTGPRSAKRILNHSQVEAAVLEIARGGILREGLAYEKADVAVFTNLSEDHLGDGGIDTLDDLLKVKSIVIETVKEDGTCVLNADDPIVMKVKERAGGDITLFSMDENNPHVSQHIQSGGTAVFVKDGSIQAIMNKQLYNIVGVNEIPATLSGKLKHNIYNSMAAIGASIAINISVDDIKRTLKEFACDDKNNPGRFNIYEIDNDIRIVLDYGHNIDGYKVTIEGLKNLKPKRLIGIIGVPGDRKDDDIVKIGRMAGASFDQVIIKEDHDLRGREPQEVADLLREAVLDSGLSEERINIILDEKEALYRALDSSNSGDVIAVFFEKMEALVEIIEKFKS